MYLHIMCEIGEEIMNIPVPCGVWVLGRLGDKGHLAVPVPCIWSYIVRHVKFLDYGFSTV